MSDDLSAGAVARHLGVAVTTLRTWHQRYGLGPSLHEPGQHRRYTPTDVARLELMQQLITTGVPPGEAARWVTRLDAQPEASADRATAAPATTDRTAADRTGVDRTAADRTAADRTAADQTGVVGLHRDGGGLSLGRALPVARGLGRAAVRLDAARVRQCVADAVADLGVVVAWDAVIRPVLNAIGERHATRGDFIDVEHLVSGCVSSVFGAVPRPSVDAPVRILLACADEEQHTLPLEALAAALAERAVPCRMLGAGVPHSALTAAVRRTGPEAVMVWSQHPRTASAEQLSAVIRGRWRPLLLAAAGPGWDPASLPPGVPTPTSMQDALALLLTATRG